MLLKKYCTSLRNIQSDNNTSSILVVYVAAAASKQHFKVIQSRKGDEIGTGTSSFNLNFAPIFDLVELVHLFDHELRSRNENQPEDCIT